MTWPRGGRHSERTREPDGVVPWDGRDGTFGWFAYAAPWWWPRGPKGPRAALLLARLAHANARIQHGLGRLEPIGEEHADGWRDRPDCNPAEAPPGGVPDFGELATPAGLCGRGHETYVRVLHAVRMQGPDGVEHLVPWRDLDDARLHEPGWRPDRLDDGGLDPGWHRGSNDEIFYLNVGELPEPECTYVEGILIDDLRRRGFEGQIVQAWWDGYGGSELPDATDIRIHQPGRELVPFVSDLPAFLAFTVLERFMPSLVFPDDGSWVLATDIDLVSTYLGCSRELADRFLAAEVLEVVEVAPDDPLG